MPIDTGLSPQQRLALSRARLRSELLRESPAGSGGGKPSSALPAWLAGLHQLPGAALIIDALAGWWERHPLNLGGRVALAAAAGWVQPVARKHPVGLVLGAALAGAVLAWSRPWRWALKPALFAGLVPQIVAKVAAQVPLEAWLAALSTAPAPSPEAPPEPAPPPTTATPD